MEILLFTIGLFIIGVQQNFTSYEGLLTDFYRRPSWRKLSYLAKAIQKQKYGYLFCNACKVKEWDVDENGQYISFHSDHVLPRSKYPERALDITNIQILCQECNLAKSNLDMTDWR